MNIQHLLDVDSIQQIKEQEIFQSEQYGNTILTLDQLENMTSSAPLQRLIYLVGCNDIRGNYKDVENNEVPHTKRIREAFYRCYNWHSKTKVVDLGNIINGYSSNDTKAALKQLYAELVLEQPQQQAMMLVVGGSPDMIQGAYQAYSQRQQKVDITVVGASLPIIPNAPTASRSYLLDILIEENSLLHHYAHIGFQSYLTSVDLLTNLDKFAFQNVRLGLAKENLDALEPLFRQSGMVSFDLSALAPTAYPMFHESPVGFNHEEICRLMQFAGMATRSNFLHIGGYDARKDIYNYYALAISQMLWYAIEGFTRFENDVEPSNNLACFKAYDIEVNEHRIQFLQSRFSDRWWMLAADQQFIPCDYLDYEQAIHNKMSERWLKSIDR